MATGKNSGGSSGKSNMDWGGGVRNPVVRSSNDRPSSDSHIPWSLLIAVVVLCFVLVIALPVMGLMYMDMNNAVHLAKEEIRKMRELRAKILLGE